MHDDEDILELCNEKSGKPERKVCTTNFNWLSIWLSIYLPTYLSIHVFSIHASIYLFIKEPFKVSQGEGFDSPRFTLSISILPLLSEPTTDLLPGVVWTANLAGSNFITDHLANEEETEQGAEGGLRPTRSKHDTNESWRSRSGLVLQCWSCCRARSYTESGSSQRICAPRMIESGSSTWTRRRRKIEGNCDSEVGLGSKQGLGDGLNDIRFNEEHCQLCFTPYTIVQ